MNLEAIDLPRPFINKLLHTAQQAGVASVNGLVGAHESKPQTLYPVKARGFALDADARRSALQELTAQGETLFALFHTSGQADTYPDADTIADSEDPETVRLVISLDIKGVLQLSAWRLTQGKLEKIGIGMREA